MLLDPPTAPGAGLNIQNLAYAAQWWIFGAFAVILWLRLVRDEARGSGTEPSTGPAEGGAAAPLSAGRFCSPCTRPICEPGLVGCHDASVPWGEGVVAQRVHPGRCGIAVARL